MSNKDIEKKISTAFSHAAPDVFENILAAIEGNAALKLKGTALQESGGATEISKSSESGLKNVSGAVAAFTSKEAEGGGNEHCKADNERQTEIIGEEKIKKRKVGILRVALIALAAAAAIFIPVGISSYNAVNTIASVVSIDVNPSIQINVNKSRKVLSVEAMNDDAKNIIGDMNFKGTDLNVAINAILGSMISKGYLSEIANSILISVDNADPAEAEALRELLMSEVEKILQSDTFNGAIIAQTIKDDAKLRELAEQYGITLSKAQLINEIINQNPKLKFEDLVKLPINDLNLLKKSDSDGITSIGNASDTGYVGVDAATQTALENAGFDKDKVQNLSVGMDYEDGKLVYEVDFNADGTVFEYEIDAMTGKILKGELEKKEAQAQAAAPAAQSTPAAQQKAETVNQQPAVAPQQQQQQQQQPAQPSLISYEQAKNAALSHAGVGAGSIYDYDIELDYDGGAHYEVEFKSGNTEYSYDINAYNGSVIWYEIEYDDDDYYVAPAQAQPQVQQQALVQTQAPAQTKAAAPADIGAGKAKSIALGHAGVSAGSARDMEVESDYEDGRLIYEIEFKAGGYEYSYEIDAATGQILDFEKDDD